MFAVLSIADKCNTKSVFCAYHIKLLLFVFILILIGSNCIFSQDATNYNISKFTYDYNYYGFPFYIDAGYMNKKKSRQIFFPLVGPSLELKEYGINIYANVKSKFYYKRFFVLLEYKQGLLNATSEKYLYSNLENYGQLSIGSFFDSFTARYRLSFDKQYSRSTSNNSISNIVQLNNYIDVQSLLYDDLLNKLSFDSSLAIKTIPYKKESSYNIYACFPYTFNHYWGELGIMPAIYYSEYFNNSEKDYAIGNNYLFTLLMLDLSKPKNNNILYNFIAHTHIEYKFFMRFLPLLYNSLYIVFYANAGYGKNIIKILIKEACFTLPEEE